MSQSFVALSANSDEASDFPSAWNLFRDSLLSLHSGTSRPSYAAAGTLWYDTSTKSIKFFDGAADIKIGGIDDANHNLRVPSGSGANTLPSAATVDLGSVDDNFIIISGVANVSDFGTNMRTGQVKFCSSSGSFKLIHNNLSLILPGASDITTAAGDSFAVVCLSSGKYRVLFYTLAASASSGFSTGDVKFTIKTVADSGWIIANDGTIGNGLSGATARSNDDCQDLYVLIWTNIANTWAPVTGGRGGNALADFNAAKPIAITKMLGRSLGVAGFGELLTGRALGGWLGSETHTLVTGEMPSHTHAISDPGHTHYIDVGSNLVTGGITPGNMSFTGGHIENTLSNTTGISVNNSGGGGSHNNMQPTFFLNAMIKL